MESLLLKSIKKEDFSEELDFIVKFYQEDFQAEMLHMQLNIPAQNYPPDAGSDVHSIIKFLRLSSISQRELISQVCSLDSHILVMPATNAVSERSFSSLRRVKSYLRSTMSESRLNNLMMLYIHIERSDSLSLISIANNFVDLSDHRQTMFGTFTESDL